MALELELELLQEEEQQIKDAEKKAKAKKKRNKKKPKKKGKKPVESLGSEDGGVILEDVGETKNIEVTECEHHILMCASCVPSAEHQVGRRRRRR